MSTMIYRISKKFFLTMDIVRQLEGRIGILYPSTKTLIEKRVGKQLIKIYILAFVTIIILFIFADISLYFTLIVMATIYVVADSSIHKGLGKLEVKLLDEMLVFIEAVKFRFQFDGMIEEALLEAINDSGYEMSIHGQIIYDSLKESYYRDRCDYEELCPNHFFFTFYSLCESVIMYGDKKGEEGSLFIKNLGYLKEDINIHILKQKSIENTFMGLIWICILPIYFMKPIELWALSNMPELTSFFEGSIGKATTIILSLMCMGIYEIVSSLKYSTAAIVLKKRWVEGLAKIKWISRFTTRYMNRHVEKMTRIEKILKSVLFPYNIHEFCIKRFVASLVAFIVAIIVSCTIGLKIYGLIVGALSYICVYYGHMLSIKLKKQLMLLEREDEIIRFQGIILMLMHADRITIEQILGQMERFAVSFRKEIEEIGDKLSFVGMSVFKEYKDKSDFLPFNRLIDGFIACDDMYIYKAFEDVETDRRYYIEKHKQENAFYIEQRGAISKFLSFIPLCSVVIFKLVVPFVIEGVKQMTIGNMNF